MTVDSTEPGNQEVRVVLISRDAELHNLCREILTGIAGANWNLITPAARSSVPDGDLYIWDYEPASELPGGWDHNPANHLFLVHRNDVPGLQHHMEGEMNVLLKPVSRATLTAFLESALSMQAGPSTATANLLRADRDKILQCLIQTNLRIQEYDQDRTNFLTRAVHDFRAPLTAVTGYCGLLLNEAMGPLNESQREVLQRMHHSAKRLSRMASAMFQLSVGRHVKRQPNLVKGDIRECVEQATHEIAPFAESKRISIMTEVEPTEGELYFDRGQIEQLLINILDNACKFTPKNGDITIQGRPVFWERRVTRYGNPVGRERRVSDQHLMNGYQIDIRDSGPLIPPEHLESIFEEYTSYGGGQDRSGGGLGLAICRMITTLHGGRIWAENTESGPRFSFVLPLHHTAPAMIETQKDIFLKMEIQ